MKEVNFENEIQVRWADVDQNRHVRHSAYYDYGAHCRIQYFKSIGLNSIQMAEQNIGPVIFNEACSFIKELHPDDRITINLRKGEISEDGSRWVLHHEIFNSKNEKSAHLTLKGAWMDLSKRKLTIPPKDVAVAMHALKKGEEYAYKKKA